ncbi:DUF924 family protein [Parvularcula lutaonensis]|uniref:DUF924 family protein n=1 Tax=Parvularcula lutaonensis TaxID=491923 RepID=A0ABV7MED2_9PROT|nr:DUF924 family protein [Parvularcula lutaonensis]GGY55163.1 membrane protein [Parvularcula lutaonensis]
MPQTTDNLATDILKYWFEELPPEKHFTKDEKVDDEIRRRFGDLHTDLSREIPADWRATRHRRLAAIILLDQFSRNLYRGDRRAFAQDAVALDLANQAIASGDLDHVPGPRGAYIVMPLMHAENVTDVRRSITLLQRIGQHENARYGRLHLYVIERFGRYPGRNGALGRANTPAEEAYLAAGGGF